MVKMGVSRSRTGAPPPRRALLRASPRRRQRERPGSGGAPCAPPPRRARRPPRRRRRRARVALRHAQAGARRRPAVSRRRGLFLAARTPRRRVRSPSSLQAFERRRSSRPSPRGIRRATELASRRERILNKPATRPAPSSASSRYACSARCLARTCRLTISSSGLAKFATTEPPVAPSPSSIFFRVAFSPLRALFPKTSSSSSRSSRSLGVASSPREVAEALACSACLPVFSADASSASSNASTSSGSATVLPSTRPYASRWCHLRRAQRELDHRVATAGLTRLRRPLAVAPRAISVGPWRPTDVYDAGGVGRSRRKRVAPRRLYDMHAAPFRPAHDARGEPLAASAAHDQNGLARRDREIGAPRAESFEKGETFSF